MKSRTRSGILAALACAAATTVPALSDAATAVSVPLSCDRGPSGQHADMIVDVPATVDAGQVFTVRIDGRGSGIISHTGLRYIHDMTTSVLVPEGTAYVSGSARIVPNTGTANVRPGARVTKQGGVVSMVLPAQVPDGGSYTPPSFEFQLQVAAPPGARIEQRFWQYRVTAKAIIIGDVLTVCDPTPKPYSIGSTTVKKSASQP